MPAVVRRSALVLPLLALLSVGCLGTRTGEFDQHGYLNTQYGYRVVNDGSELLGPDWLIDNFYPRNNALEPKQVDEYTITYELDVNGDGQMDLKEKTLLYDLRYKHKSHDASIWLRAFPVSAELRDKDLRVLVQRYVDAVAGAGYEAVKLGAGVVVEERRFAPQMLERGTARASAELDAYMATFDVANVDEIAVSPNARKRRVQVVMVRPPFEHTSKRTSATFPVLMIAGYANLPEDFETDKPAFVSFLSRIQVEERAGFQPLAVEPVSAAATADSAPQAPAGSVVPTEATAVTPPPSEP